MAPRPPAKQRPQPDVLPDSLPGRPEPDVLPDSLGDTPSEPITPDSLPGRDEGDDDPSR